MALTDCPGCGKKVSEYAESCPKCTIDVQEKLAEIITNERIKELKILSEKLIKDEEYEEALEYLNELLELSPVKDKLQQIIKQTEIKLKTLQVSRALKEAKHNFIKEKFSQTIKLCDFILTHNQNDPEAMELLEKAVSRQKLSRSKNLKLLLCTVILLLVFLAAGSGFYIYSHNTAHLATAEKYLQKNKISEAKKEIEKCIVPVFREILAPDFYIISKKVNTIEQLIQERAEAKDFFDKKYNSKKTEIRNSNYVLNKISQTIARSESEVNNHKKAIELYRFTSELIDLAFCESNAASASINAKTVENAHLLDESGWKEAMVIYNRAAEDFKAGLYKEAASSWKSAETFFRESEIKARQINLEIKIAKEEQREKEKKAQLVKTRQKALAMARRINGKAKNSFAYQKAIRAGRNQSWEKAIEYYELAARYAFSQGFNGRLGFSSKWRLDGNWSNEHRIYKSLNRDAIVYFFINSTSGSGIDFYMKSPRGYKDNLYNEDHIKIERAGQFKIGAESRGRVSYNVRVEVYN